jgi:hypothetical protein
VLDHVERPNARAVTRRIGKAMADEKNSHDHPSQIDAIPATVISVA